MKTTKGGKVMNPTDAYRKELRKKELKRNKKERKKVREVGILKKDPDSLKEQIAKLDAAKAEGALDKARKHKKRQLEDTLNLVLKKRKEFEEKQKEKGETPVMFSHLGPVRRRTAEEEERVKHPTPEDSVYYHPTLNPTGAPPPGKPPMFKSSIGPRVPLSAASSSGATSSSVSEADDGTLQIPPPPPPPPLPPGEPDAGDASLIPASLPLPPPPPMPPKPLMTDQGLVRPPFPPPPPPPGLPVKEEVLTHPPLPPPPPLPVKEEVLSPLTGGSERENSRSAKSDDHGSRGPSHSQTATLPLPPPPPPVGLPPNLTSNQLEGSASDPESRMPSQPKDFSKIIPPPPPPIRQQPPLPRPGMVPIMQQPDVLPPGITSFAPPHLPSDARPPLGGPGITGLPPPPGVMVPVMPRPPFGPPPGPPPMMRPPLPPGPPPMFQDDSFARLPVPQKPSYVKSAASTVVKRPLAQHTPELTAMVPASVQVRRESVLPKAKAKPATTTATATIQPVVAAPVAKQVTSTSSSAPKPQSVDDSYMAFLEDMKALGALDS